MPDKNAFMATDVVAQATSPGKLKKLLEQVRDLLRLKHYSLRSERCHCEWIERFIRFHGKRHPPDLGEEEVSAFLTHLTRDGQVASSSQNQTLSALLFLYKGVLKQEIGWLDGVERAKRPVRQPLVLTRAGLGSLWHNASRANFESQKANRRGRGRRRARPGCAASLHRFRRKRIR